jgi:hypothetical protein
MSSHHFIGIPGQDFSGRIFDRQTPANAVQATHTRSLRHGVCRGLIAPACLPRPNRPWPGLVEWRRTNRPLLEKVKKSLAESYFVPIIITVMATNVQFSIAVHLMAGLACARGEDITSARLARSINTSPSFVRRVLAKLSRAGLVETATGKAGSCWLAREAKVVSLLDIYKAVDAPKAFSIHNYTAL